MQITCAIARYQAEDADEALDADGLLVPCQLIGRPAGYCWITRPTEPAGRETSCAFSPETTKQVPFPTCRYMASWHV